MKTRSIIEDSTAKFPLYESESYGTDHYHRLNQFVPDLIGTDGIMMMAVDLEAMWFTDVVASYMNKIKKLYAQDDEQTFFVCRISKLEGDKALFSIDDGNEGEPFITQEIPYSDIKTNLKTYLQLGSLDGVTPKWILMMPSEY